MPTLSEQQALIRAILLATEDEIALYFSNLEQEDDEFESSGSETSEAVSQDAEMLSSSTGTSSTSSTSSSSTSSSSSSSSDSNMDISDPEEATESITADTEAAVHLQHVLSYTERLEAILASRYVNPRTPVPKSSQLYLVLVEFKADHPRNFRLNLRVSPSTFDELVTRIENHPIFQSRSNSQQFPVEIQLAIAMYHFGHDGNAASVEGVAQWAGVSAGMVVKSTRRVIIAFLSLHDTVIRWPSEAEKEDASDWVESVSCPAWRAGLCMVDGTLIPLFEKPGHHGEAYFDRKSNYSMNVQVWKYILFAMELILAIAYHTSKSPHH